VYGSKICEYTIKSVTEFNIRDEVGRHELPGEMKAVM
jgi:hypothetical protein